MKNENERYFGEFGGQFVSESLMGIIPWRNWIRLLRKPSAKKNF